MTDNQTNRIPTPIIHNDVTISPSFKTLSISIPSPTEMVSEFLSGYKPTTIKGYNRDLDLFRRWAELPNLESVYQALIGNGYAYATRIIHAYKAHLVAAPKSASTINRRIAAIKALISFAQQMGVIEWRLNIKNIKRRPMRDTTGCTERDVVQLLRAAKTQIDPRIAARDVALLWLLYCPALRVGEVASLDSADVDLDRQRVHVVGKGHHDKQPVPIPDRVTTALSSWLDCRQATTPDTPTPLFIALDNVHYGHRLTTWSIGLMFKRLAKVCGVHTHPHGLRHASITAALEADLSIHKVRQFSRHADLNMLLIYDDQRKNSASEVCDVLASRITALE